MEKPCWIFRLLNSVTSSWKQSLDYINHVQYTGMDNKHPTINRLFTPAHIISKCVDYFAIAIAIGSTAIMLLILDLFIGILAARFIGIVNTYPLLNHPVIKIVTNIPMLQIAGLGLITIIISACILYILYTIVKYSFIYLKKNILFAKLWDKHEKHIVNN